MSILISQTNMGKKSNLISIEPVEIVAEPGRSMSFRAKSRNLKY